MKETLNLYSYDESNTLLSSEYMSHRNIDKLKAAQKITANNNGLVVPGFPALHPNCQCLVGHACVSMNLSSVSTPSLRSVGHSPQVHGTPAQFYMATSPSLYVVRNGYAQDKMQNTERQFTPKGNALHRAGLNQKCSMMTNLVICDEFRYTQSWPQHQKPMKLEEK